jgi:obg-like ATPase 1
LLLTAKPVIYIANLSERDFLRQKNKYLAKVKAWIDENNPGDVLIPLSVAFEDRLTRMTHEEATEECKNLKTKSQIGKLVVTMRKALRLISFFTTGTDEVRQWSIREGTKAPQAAGVIHGDFEKTFIQAVISRYDDLKELGSEAEVKAAGKLLIKGKDYLMEDGDM